MSDQLVWYVSYGSNLYADRFRCYLEGGAPPNGLWSAPGARDATPARADRRIDLPMALHFGGPSFTWRGAPAYLELDRAGSTIGRAWCVGIDQFEDVVAQENHISPGEVQLSQQLLREGGVLLPGERYGRLVALPPIDGVPAATFTYVERPVARPPDEDYLAMLRGGLVELGLTEGEARRYLDDQVAAAAA